MTDQPNDLQLPDPTDIVCVAVVRITPGRDRIYFVVVSVSLPNTCSSFTSPIP